MVGGSATRGSARTDHKGDWMGATYITAIHRGVGKEPSPATDTQEHITGSAPGARNGGQNLPGRQPNGEPDAVTNRGCGLPAATTHKPNHSKN